MTPFPYKVILLSKIQDSQGNRDSDVGLLYSEKIFEALSCFLFVILEVQLDTV